MQTLFKTDFEKISNFYKVLSDKIRLQIIYILLNEPKCICVCQLAKKLNRDQSVIYKHIQILKKEGIVNTHKEKKFLQCCIKEKKLCNQILFEIKG